MVGMKVHIMNAKEKIAYYKKHGKAKGFGSHKTSWDSKNPIAWRQAKLRSEKMKHIKSFKLFESPDSITLEDGITTRFYRSEGARPFGIIDGIMMVHSESLAHWTAFQLERFNMKFPGRLFTNEKIITFWEFPTQEEMPGILRDIENVYNRIGEDQINFYDGIWKIETLFKRGTETITSIGSDEMDWNKNVKDEDGDSVYIKYIPISEYIGSEKRTPAQLAMKHLEVGKGGAKKGWGSRKYDDKLPKGMSDAEYRNKKTKYKYTENFSSFKLNENPDTIQLKNDKIVVDFLSNDTELKYNDEDARAFGIIRKEVDEYVNNSRDYLFYDKKSRLLGSYSSLHHPSMLLDTIFHNIDEYDEYKLKTDFGSPWDANNYFDVFGRYWINTKILSFWTYPKNKQELDEIINNINKKSNTKIDDTWRIEINENDENDKKVYRSVFHNSKLIPISEYKKSEDITYINHLEVGKGGAKKGWGSRKYDDKLPKGMSDAEYRNKKTKYKYTEKINNFKK